MKLKLGQLVSSVEVGALQQLANDAALPIATAWRMKKLWKAALDELTLYNEKRMECCEQYGKVNSVTNQFEFLDKDGNKDVQKEAKFNAIVKELLAIDIELPGEPFTINDFEPRKFDAPSLPFSPANLLVLEWLLIEDSADILNATNLEQGQKAATNA